MCLISTGDVVGVALEVRPPPSLLLGAAQAHPHSHPRPTANTRFSPRDKQSQSVRSTLHRRKASILYDCQASLTSRYDFVPVLVMM